MFPMEFDHEALDSLPLPDKEGTGRILQILRTIWMARIMPYFKSRRVVDPTVIARISEGLAIQRWEDGNNLEGSKGIKVFADNYAIQRVKIKSCKPLLNRADYSLSH